MFFYSLETPRDENILLQTNFTQKYPMVNFSKLRYVIPLNFIHTKLKDVKTEAMQTLTS